VDLAAHLMDLVEHAPPQTIINVAVGLDAAVQFLMHVRDEQRKARQAELN